MPLPPLDGGKIVISLIEAIRGKPFKENVEIAVQLTGMILLIGLSIFVTYRDIVEVF